MTLPAARAMATPGAAQAAPSAALALVFALAVIKAASADITWDEAWTYLFYGRTWRGFLLLTTPTTTRSTASSSGSPLACSAIPS